MNLNIDNRTVVQGGAFCAVVLLIAELAARLPFGGLPNTIVDIGALVALWAGFGVIFSGMGFGDASRRRAGLYAAGGAFAGVVVAALAL